MIGEGGSRKKSENEQNPAHQKSGPLRWSTIAGLAVLQHKSPCLDFWANPVTLSAPPLPSGLPPQRDDSDTALYVKTRSYSHCSEGIRQDGILLYKQQQGAAARVCTLPDHTNTITSSSVINSKVTVRSGASTVQPPCTGKRHSKHRASDPLASRAVPTCRVFVVKAPGARPKARIARGSQPDL